MRKISILFLAILPFCLFGEEQNFDSLIRKDLQEVRESPMKRIWEIEYRKDTDGSTDSNSWFVKGTPWRVRIHQPTCGFGNLDQTIVYKIEAIALDQHYGVVDFYVYGNPKAND